ncbi:MAG: acyl-ACP--UDP-N-acetylglucosamine O-acyltransferase [Parvularculaceae bacterium]|nr:acyl-ACP--UDP-N-acetylglucosamine O-acyltransferase [Parvularculaceae bacterium]
MRIHPTAIVEEGASLGEGVSIGAFCRVAASATLGDGVTLKSHVVIDGKTEIGARTVIHPFAVLGGPPQHLGYRDEETTLSVGADCIIREQVTFNLGTAAGRGATVIGDKCFFMAGAHVAHDCIVGSNVIFANNATLGGHVVIGDHVFLGGLCAIHQFCRIGSYAFIGGCAAVPTDVIPYASATGNHAQLSGLNIVGMKRRGMQRAAIHDLRAAYRLLFAEAASFQERLEGVASKYAQSEEVMRIVNFIREDTRRPLMAPPRKLWAAGENSE